VLYITIIVEVLHENKIIAHSCILTVMSQSADGGNNSTDEIVSVLCILTVCLQQAYLLFSYSSSGVRCFIQSSL